MLKRVFALCAVGIALSAVSLQAQDLFVLPGAGAASSEVQAFVTNPLTTFRTFNPGTSAANPGTGAFAVLPNLDASKFFVVASATTDSVYAMDGALLTATPVANLSAPPTQVVITPDGTVLAVAAGSVHLFDTATNSELVPGGISQGSGFNAFGVAASLDSTTIYALESNSGGSSQLTAISASTHAVTATLALPSGATAVSVAPNGRVYVSLPEEILEVDPRKLQATFDGTISATGTPGPLVFTPDGQYAIGANQSNFGNSLIVATLATHTSTNPGLGVPQITSLQVSGIDTVLALTGQGLYQITISTPISVIQVTGTSLAGLTGLTTSNDVPAGAHNTVQAAYVVSAKNIFQFNPAQQSITAQYPVAPNVIPGALAYAVPAVTTAQSNPATLLPFGTNQTILPNATSEPLVVQVLDPNNVPLSGYTVTFTSNASGGTLSSSSAITGSNGYAVTYYTAPATTGSVIVTATAGSLMATFPIEVSTTAQGGGGPTLTIIAGQGQLMLADTSTADGPEYGSSLEVLATNANGTPLAGLPVTFSVPSQDGTLQVNGGGASSQVVNTNAAGVASVDFLTTSIPGSDTEGFLQSLVTASAANTNAVTFYITTVTSNPTPSVYLLAPTPGTTLTGAEGSTLTGAVKAQVVSSAGFGIPNVALTLNDNNVNPSVFPTISCNGPGGVVLTGSSGIASCDAVFGPRIGSGTFTATIGFTHTAAPTPFIVTPGAPGEVQIKQGNNQTGGAGQTLPLALVVHVTDSGGNTIVGGTVTWKVLTPGAVTLSNIVGITDSNGNASALATLGAIGGVAQVEATAGTASATFSLTVNIPSVGIQKVSGDQQTATINTAFPLPLTVVVVDSSGNGVPGAQVNFQVTAGTATLGSSGVITNSMGQASTTVTAGGTPGAITVSATSSTFSVSFTLTAEPVGPTNITIINGASFDPNTGVSPGSIANVRGMGILPGVTGVVPAPITNGQYPTTFSGVTITFNGTPAPIYYVEDTNGNDSVAVQIPLEVQPGPAVALTVTVANEKPVTVMIPVKTLAPGIFDSVYGGKIYAVAVRPDNTQVSPTNPAQRGENIQLYVTGLGQATPPITTGTPGVPNQTLASPLVVGLNNSGVPLISAVYAPGLIGVYIVILQVPEDTQTGPYQPIGLIAYDSANNQYYAQNTYIPIQ
jgi:uncharacterized protein (TIGR03437 family)